MKRNKFFLLPGIFMISTVLISADWTTWRGPDYNGISSEADWDFKTILKGDAIVWSKNVGPGWSSFSVEGDRLWTVGNVDGKDVVYCLNANSGKEIWTFDYESDAGNYPGPRSTPIVDGNRLYGLSRHGDLYCLEKNSGSIIWSMNIVETCDAGVPTWGFASSARIAGDVILINACSHGLALSKTTGKLVWKSPPGTGNYSVPVLYTIQGKQSVAIFGDKEIQGVDLKTGELLWSYPWETKYDINAADPIFMNNQLFVSSAYGKGAALLDISGKSPKVIWQNKNMMNHFGTSVLIDGYLYGPSGRTGRSSGTLNCLDLKTGEIVWQQTLGFHSLNAADGKLIVLTEGGELIIVPASPKGYSELARAKVLEASRKSPCWTAPVLANGRIYCRNGGGDIVSIDVYQR